jgi:hypothetical protein
MAVIDTADVPAARDCHVIRQSAASPASVIATRRITLLEHGRS